MVNEDMQCELIVMACGICRELLKKPRLYAVDCEVHEETIHSTLFAGAIGAAMMHRSGVAL